MNVLTAAFALALLSGPESASGPAVPEKPESFKFTVTGGLGQIGRREERTVVIEKWTLPADAKALAALRETKGEEAVRRELLGWHAGSIRDSVASDPTAFGGAGRFPPGTSLPIGTAVHAATSLSRADGGRSVRILVSLGPCLGSLRSSLEETLPEHGIVELELDAKGDGLSGRLVPAPVIAFDASGQLARDSAVPPSLTWALVGVGAFD